MSLVQAVASTGPGGDTLIGGAIAVMIPLAGALVYWVKTRRPDAGWEAALKRVDQTAADAKTELEKVKRDAAAREQAMQEREQAMQERVARVEGEVRAVTEQNRALESALAAQVQVSDALRGRTVQLIAAWPPGTTPPPVNPAHAAYI
jgi:TolA-binding protein